jgi:predicted metalloendopeptidase
MKAQSDAYVFTQITDGVVTTYNMNAEQKMGEMLADVNGISLAYKAYCKFIDDTVNISPFANIAQSINPTDIANNGALINITRDYKREFFRAVSRVWRMKAGATEMIRRLASGPHATPDFRGNCVNNIDDFYTLFDVRPGDKMYLEPSARVQMR